MKISTDKFKIVHTRKKCQIVVAAYLRAGKELNQVFKEMKDFYKDNLEIKPMTRSELFFNQSN